MTANEIIKSIKDNLDSVEHNLEQIQCDDCISREAAIYVASGFCHPSNVAKELAKLPSVTPKPKTGHWIMSDDGLFRPICDKCGAHPWKGYIPTVEEATVVFKYCPNCGAKMEDKDADSV